MTRFFVSDGWRIWTGDDWFVGPDGEWRTTGYRYFRPWSPLDWVRRWAYGLDRLWATLAGRLVPDEALAQLGSTGVPQRRSGLNPGESSGCPPGNPQGDERTMSA